MMISRAADHGVGLHFINGSLHQVVTSPRDAVSRSVLVLCACF